MDNCTDVGDSPGLKSVNGLPEEAALAGGTRSQPMPRGIRPVALALLPGIAISFLLTFLLPEPGFWTQLGRHGLVAGLAGGLADWFAVRTLFSHQAGRENPDACAVPARLDCTGSNVSALNERTLLSPALIAARIQEINPAERLSAWLTCEANALRVAAFLVDRLPAVVSILENAELPGSIAGTLRDKVGRIDFGPVLRRTLEVLSGSREWEGLSGRMLDALLDLAFDNANRIQAAVERENAWWMPRSMSGRITNAILAALEDLVGELRSPESDSRSALTAAVGQFADDLLQSMEQSAGADSFKRRLIADPCIQAWMRSAWAKLRDEILFVVALNDEDTGTRRELSSLVVSWGGALASDPNLAQFLNELIAASAQSAATLLGQEIDDRIPEIVHGTDKGGIDHRGPVVRPIMQRIGLAGVLVGASVGCCAFLLSYVLG
jgi:uncharacterized membrane-anchored protein YjiN (DUF445 family)